MFENLFQSWEVGNNCAQFEDVSSRGKERRRKKTGGRKFGACSLEGVFLGKNFTHWVAELERWGRFGSIFL